MTAAVLLPLAHIGHWLWIFYVIPILIVIAGIIRSTRAEKRREREEEEGNATKGRPKPPR
jgi:hypothetical protein